MPDSPTKLQRWLDLIAFLVARRVPVPVEELMEQIPAYAERWRTGDATAQATARRTFERDKDELRRAGIPIRTVRYALNFGREEIEGYRLDRRDFYLPFLRLLEDGEDQPPRAGPAGTFDIAADEMDLAVQALRRIAEVPTFPFRAEARSALRKLTFDLEGGPPDDAVRTLYLERAVPEELRDTLRELSDALLARKRVRFRYHGLYRGEETEREVEPYGLVFQLGHWYLVGHDRTRDAVRVFRASRMRDVQRNTRTPATADYVVPDTFRIEEHVGRRAWELHDREERPVEARVLFRFPLSIWAARNGHGRRVSTKEDGSTVRAFDVHQVDPFLRWLLQFDGDAVVVSPAEMEKAYRLMAEEVLVRHADATDGGSNG